MKELQQKTMGPYLLFRTMRLLGILPNYMVGTAFSRFAKMHDDKWFVVGHKADTAHTKIYYYIKWRADELD